MSDGKLDDLRREADAWKAQLDARTRVKERNLIGKYGIPALLARLVDVGSVAVGIWLISRLDVLLSAIGVLFLLGGLFGFLRARGGTE
jgi:hypothetical protein